MLVAKYITVKYLSSHAKICLQIRAREGIKWKKKKKEGRMWKDMNFASCNNQKYLGTGGA